MIDTLLQGLLLGGLYALFALGLSLMFGVMRLTNVAHGDFIVLGAFSVVGLSSYLPFHPLILGIALLLPSFGFGYAIQRYVLNGTLSKDPLPSMVVTFGMSIVIQNALLQIFSADPRSLEAGALALDGIPLGFDLAIGKLPALIFLIAFLATAGLQLMFNRTALGRSFRAVSDDKEISELMGLNAKKINALATAFSFALISMAGVLQGIRTTVSPSDGPLFLLFAFEAVIVGGMGSFWGTFIGALILGIVQQIGFYFDPGWGVWGGHMVFLGVLVFRPQGLFPKTRG